MLSPTAPVTYRSSITVFPVSPSRLSPNDQDHPLDVPPPALPKEPKHRPPRPLSFVNQVKSLDDVLNYSVKTDNKNKHSDNNNNGGTWHGFPGTRRRRRKPLSYIKQSKHLSLYSPSTHAPPSSFPFAPPEIRASLAEPESDLPDYEKNPERASAFENFKVRLRRAKSIDSLTRRKSAQKTFSDLFTSAQSGAWGTQLKDQWENFVNKIREKQILEQQALEACNWLRAAGFPQYPSLYEEGSFPLDVNMVTKDHDFLEEELIEPLKRRLAILNKCASMKLNRISVDTGSQTEDEDEEQIPFAISERWHYDESNRWSRNNDDTNEDKSNVESRDNEQVYQRTISADTSSVSSSREVLNRRNKGTDSDGTRSTTSGNKLKLKPSILKKVGDLKKLRTPSFRRNAKETSSYKREKSRDIVIGEPELQSGHEKLGQFRCIPISERNSDVLMSLQQQHLKNTFARPRKNSSQSLTSTSSSSAGGSSAASTPATRSRSFRDKKSAHHRGRSVDAVLRDPTSPILMNNKQLLKSQAGGGAQKVTPTYPENKVFLVPKTHTPGTFPTMMSEVNEEENSSEESDLPMPSTKPQKRRLHKVKQRSISDFAGNHRATRPVSIYDNITESKLHPAASAQDLLDILTRPSPTSNDVTDASFWSVDDIMRETESLKQRVHTWEDEENSISNRNRLNSADYTTQQTSEESRTVSPLSASNENLYESQEALNNDGDDSRSTTTHVSRVEWMGHRQPLASVNSEPLQLHNLSVGQLMILSRLSVLKLTATMEKYGPVGGPKSNNLSWTVPRFIRRAKVPVYKDRDVFSVPLVHNVQKYGHPIPCCILNAMAYLHNEAMDQVGLFRKSGVKSRIQKIRNMCEKDPDLSNFDIEEVNAYDVADMVKQYFRDLPDHLMTTKLSETFIGIFLYVPDHLRLQSLHTAIMLLPDENREALKTLLCFLKRVADRSDENQMNESNLAVCFAPSIFYQHSPFSMSMSNPPKGRKSSRHGNMLALGKPDSKEMNENNAANLCLAFMIQKVKDLFTIPEDAMTHCRLSVMQQTQDVLASELGYQIWDSQQTEFLRDFRSYVNKIVTQTVRDENRLSNNKTKDWNFLSTENGTEMCYKKITDGNPLRLWRCRVEIEGVTSEQVLRRVKDERHIWDDDLIEERVVEQLDETTECYQCIRAETRPHPPRDYCVMRTWSANVSPRNLTVMVETSTEHPDAPLEEGVRGVVLTSQYTIECVTTTQSNSSDYTSSNSSLSSSGGPTQKCYLTRLCRVDTKGRNPEWYNKAFGFITLRGLTKVRDSFRVQNNNNFIHAKPK